MYSDSQITLAWVKKSPTQLQTYVANRVAHIQELSSSYEYRYVRTAANPADLVSRGIQLEALVGNKLWWNGPEFSQQNPFEEEKCEEVIDLPEVKVAALFTSTNVHMSKLEKFNSF